MTTQAPELADDDLELLRRYADAGDAEAFAEIVRRYAGVVFGTCNRILHDRARAEDVSQDTFFRLLRDPRYVTHSLGGWLHRSATRLALDARRSELSRYRRERAYAGRAPEFVPSPLRGASDGPPESPTWDEISPHIDKALDALNEEQRSLLIRHFLQGVSQSALAEEADTSPATMCRRIKAAVDALRDKLSRQGVHAVGATFAALWLAHSATPAPASLMSELGKMALSGGASPALAAQAPPTIGTAPSWLSRVGGARGLGIGAVTAGALVIAGAAFTAARRPTPSQPAPTTTHPVSTTQLNAAALPSRYVRLPGAATTLSTEQVSLFEWRGGDADSVNVVFGDGHTVEMPMPDARRLVESQAGQTLEALARGAEQM